MEEIWKDIEGFSGFYQVSNLGRIRSLNHTVVRANGVKHSHVGHIIRPQHYKNGYQFVSITKGSTRKQLSVHRAVLIAFKGIKPGYEVNHIDENKDNNRLDNLEWVTHQYNCQHGTRNIRCKEHSDFRGKKNPMYGRKGELSPRSKKCYAEKDGIAWIFESVEKLAEFLGCTPQYAGRIANHLRKTNIVKGYKLYTEDNFQK